MFGERMSRPIITALAAVLVSICFACGVSSKMTKPVAMGSKVQAGALIYTVLDVEWADDLTADGASRVPEKRFAIVRLNISNAGSRPVDVPLMSMVNTQGAAFLEQTEGKGVEEWWGILRTVNPGETLNRRILFDVAAGDYNLRLSDGGDSESETFRYVSLPYRLRESSPVAPITTETDSNR